MGHGYKGDTGHHHSLSENLDDLKSSFKYNEDTGYFGDKGESSDNKVRNISSEDPAATAKEFYDKATYGGKEEPLANGKGAMTQMSDGTVITYRPTSSSDGSPAVSINITSTDPDTGGVKSQKIHFVKE